MWTVPVSNPRPLDGKPDALQLCHWGNNIDPFGSNSLFKGCLHEIRSRTFHVYMRPDRFGILWTFSSALVNLLSYFLLDPLKFRILKVSLSHLWFPSMICQQRLFRFLRSLLIRTSLDQPSPVYMRLSGTGSKRDSLWNWSRLGTDSRAKWVQVRRVSCKRKAFLLQFGHGFICIRVRVNGA